MLLGLSVGTFLGTGIWVAGFVEDLPAVSDAQSVTSLRRRELLKAGLNPHEDRLGWSIHIERRLKTQRTRAIPWRGEVTETTGSTFQWVEFTGNSAIAIARKAFPLLNRSKTTGTTIGDALEMIRTNGGVAEYLRWAAGAKPPWVRFRDYPDALRLSLEIALFQGEERKALEGELRGLEYAWREAEAIASISDGLLPPKGWAEFREIHLAEE